MMMTLNILLLFSLVVATAAWSSSPAPFKLTTTTTTTLHAASSSSSTRRSFLFGTTIVATSILTSHPTPAAAATLTPETALQQWKDSVKTIDNLCENWDTISKAGGDAIRKELGTANFGTTPSPLFQLDKAFKVLRDNDDFDVMELTEQAEELSNALARADTMAYSSNFAGGSGKPTPPQVYIDKAKKEVLEMQSIAKSVSAALSL